MNHLMPIVQAVVAVWSGAVIALVCGIAVVEL